ILYAVKIPGKVAERLFETNAAFSRFSSRIAGCYAFRLISDVEQDDLTLIRRIRSDFAHRLDTSFETPSVQSRCRGLKTRIPECLKTLKPTLTLQQSILFYASSIDPHTLLGSGGR